MTDVFALSNAANQALPENPTYADIRDVADRFSDGDKDVYIYLIELLMRGNESVLYEIEERTHSLQRVDWRQLANREQKSQWLLEPVLPNGRLVALYALGKTGKSLLTLDMSLALATGREILKRPAAEPVTVMYIDQEMTLDDLEERVDALGYDPSEDDLSRLVYYQLQAFKPFDTPEGAEQLIHVVERDKPSLVVIDTTARIVQGPENDADTYRNLYRESLQHLKAMGVTVLRLDHAGKKVKHGQRGSSAKNDDVDLVWQLEPHNNHYRLVNERQRISWVPKYVEMKRVDGRHTIRNLWDVSSPAVTDCVRDLDKVAAPLDISVRRAQKLLMKYGFSGRGTDTRTEAISYRKRLAANRPDPPPNVPDTTKEHTPAPRNPKNEEHQQERQPTQPTNTDGNGTLAFPTEERNTPGTPTSVRSSLSAPPPGGAEKTRDIEQAEQNLIDLDLVETESEEQT